MNDTRTAERSAASPHPHSHPQGTDAPPLNRTPTPIYAYPELRGEDNHDCRGVGDMDRRYGVPVALGSIVQAAELDVCRVVGGNEELAILLTKDGKYYAEFWGALWVQASGPGFAPTAKLYADTPPTEAQQPDLGSPAPAKSIALRLFELVDGLAATARDIEDQLDAIAEDDRTLADASTDFANHMLKALEQLGQQATQRVMSQPEGGAE
ncbi:MAG: hypothetical protein AAF750_06620 [Planctomycetota bacterium]